MHKLAAIAMLGLTSAVGWLGLRAQEIKPAVAERSYKHPALGFAIEFDPTWRVELPGPEDKDLAARQQQDSGYEITPAFEASLVARQPKFKEDIEPPLFAVSFYKPTKGEPDPLKFLNELEKSLRESPLPAQIEEAARRQEFYGVKYAVDVLRIDCDVGSSRITTFATAHKGQLIVVMLRYSKPEDLTLLKSALGKAKFD